MNYDPFIRLCCWILIPDFRLGVLEGKRDRVSALLKEVADGLADIRSAQEIIRKDLRRAPLNPNRPLRYVLADLVRREEKLVEDQEKLLEEKDRLSRKISQYERRGYLSPQ